MTKTYDIAFIGDLLIATVPHGADIVQAVRDYCDSANIPFEEPDVTEGVYLTDEPGDDDTIVYSGTSMGYLIDEHDNTYKYAVTR